MEHPISDVAPSPPDSPGSRGTDKGESPYPYNAGETRIIGGTGSSTPDAATEPDFDNSGIDSPGGTSTVAVFGESSGPQCLDVFDEACLEPEDSCPEDATADVILGEDGEVLSVICYPTRDYEVITLDDAPLEDPELGNNTVVVLDGEDDGADIEGNVKIEGNNVILYGQGPDTSVIDGNLDIAKNNAIVRGVRITGNVTLTKNNTSLIYCVIEGDLHITMNNTSVALCEVWGNVHIEGNNSVFVSNAVEGDQKISGVRR